MNDMVLSELNIISALGMKPNFSDLSKKYGFDRRTIKKYYEGYKGKSKKRIKKSILDEFKDIITLKLAIKGVKVKSVYEILIDKYGFNKVGTYSNFNKYVKKNKLFPKKADSYHPRFETDKGVQAQAYWKEDMKLRNRSGKVFTFQVFDYKLGYSRYPKFIYKKAKTTQTVIDSLIECFKATGGVPKEILFDNMSSIVNISDGKRNINNKFMSFSKDFHFKIKLAKPRHAFTKGKVEVINKFVEWIIPYDREFDTEEELISILNRINEKVITNVCQATGVTPLLLYEKERPYLQLLPDEKLVNSYISSAKAVIGGLDALITYKTNKYSIPKKYIGKTLLIKENDEYLEI